MYQFRFKELEIVALSDTHGLHRDVVIPTCDLLIHLGDACQSGNQGQLDDFFEWVSEQSARYKIFIAGNHDLPFEFYPEMAERLIPANVLFLQNRIVEIEGVVIAGVEATPYMLYQTEIDEPVDIILSHGAPKGLADNGSGCEKLLELIYAVKPKIALFGHIHTPTQSVIARNGIKFVNVNQNPQYIRFPDLRFVLA